MTTYNAGKIVSACFNITFINWNISLFYRNNFKANVHVHKAITNTTLLHYNNYVCVYIILRVYMYTPHTRYTCRNFTYTVHTCLSTQTDIVPVTEY